MRQPAHGATQAVRWGLCGAVAVAQGGTCAGGRKGAGGGWFPEGGHSRSLRGSGHSKACGRRGLLQWLAGTVLDPGVFFAFFVCFLVPLLLGGASPATLALPQLLPFSETAPGLEPPACSLLSAACGRPWRLPKRRLAETRDVIAAHQAPGREGLAASSRAAQRHSTNATGSALGSGGRSPSVAIPAVASAVQTQAPDEAVEEPPGRSSPLNWEMLRALQRELDANGTAWRGGAHLGALEGKGAEGETLQALRVFVYEVPTRYTYRLLKRDTRCLSHMFAAEVYFHHFILRSPVRTLDPAQAQWFYTPLYLTCDLTDKGLPLPFRAPRMMRSAIRFISQRFPFWNRTEGADHFFITPHDFGACFHFQVRPQDTPGNPFAWGHRASAAWARPPQGWRDAAMGGHMWNGVLRSGCEARREGDLTPSCMDGCLFCVHCVSVGRRRRRPWRGAFCRCCSEPLWCRHSGSAPTPATRQDPL